MTGVVLPVTAQRTYDLRHAVLRVGRPRSSCMWEGDDLPTTRHFILEKRPGEALAIVSYFMRPRPHEAGEGAWQLRGMAVDPRLRGGGLGTRLCLESLAQLGELAPSIGWVWCNARVSAVPFYQLLGFTGVGDPFDIEGVGPHLLMEWKFR